MEQVVGGGVLGVVGDHAADDGQIVHALRDVWKQITDRDARLPVLLELPGRPKDVAVVVELRIRHLHWQRLAVLGPQARLGVKGVHLRRAAIHVEEDHGLGLGRMVQAFVRPGGGQTRQGETRKATSAEEKVAAGHRVN